MARSTILSNLIIENYRIRYLSDILVCLKDIRDIIKEKLPPIISKYLGASWILKPLYIKRIAQRMNDELAIPILNAINNSSRGNYIKKVVFVPHLNAKAGYINGVIMIGVSNAVEDFDYRNYLPIIAHELFHSIQLSKRSKFFDNIDTYNTYAKKHNLLNRDADSDDIQDYRIRYHAVLKERQAWYVGILTAAAMYEIQPAEFSTIMDAVIEGSKRFLDLTSKYKLLSSDLEVFYNIVSGIGGMTTDSERRFFINYLSKFSSGYEKFYKLYTSILK